MSAPAGPSLQGLQDILPPPLLAQSEVSGGILIASLLSVAALVGFAWFRYRRSPLQQNRQRFRRLTRQLQQLGPAQAAAVLEKILLDRFHIPHLHNYPGNTATPLITEQDWQLLVTRIYQARFSGKNTIDLQPALQRVQQLLWVGRT